MFSELEVHGACYYSLCWNIMHLLSLLLTAYSFQENLLKTMLHIEETFHDLAVSVSSARDCLVICDRGAMDATAC